MIKMLNQNMIQGGTQATWDPVIIGWCSPNSRHRRLDGHLVNVGCFFFSGTRVPIKETTQNQRFKNKIWTREENKVALQYYFMSKPTQKGYKKNDRNLQD